MPFTCGCAWVGVRGTVYCVAASANGIRAVALSSTTGVPTNTGPPMISPRNAAVVSRFQVNVPPPVFRSVSVWLVVALWPTLAATLPGVTLTAGESPTFRGLLRPVALPTVRSIEHSCRPASA